MSSSGVLRTVRTRIRCLPWAPEEREAKPPGRFRILANGRFTRRRKGSRLVVRAVDRLARRIPGLEIVFFDTSTVDHRAGLPPDLTCRARVRLDLDIPRSTERDPISDLVKTRKLLIACNTDKNNLCQSIAGTVWTGFMPDGTRR